MSTSWLVIQTQDSIADSECVWSSEMVPSDKEYDIGANIVAIELNRCPDPK